MELNDWQYDEFAQVGKDYNSKEEVSVYEETHSRFRNLIEESNQLLDFLSVKSGETLIDFGCGTGVLAIQAALRGVKVFAVDISENMLAYAEQQALEKDIRSIRFIHSGFLNYNHPLQSVNYITTSFSFHHLPDFWKVVALKRMNSLLKDLGVLYIQDVVISEENCVNNIHSFIESQTQLGGDFLKNDAIEHFRDEFSTYDWILEAMLGRTGFEIKSKESFLGLIYRYTCVKITVRKPQS